MRKEIFINAPFMGWALRLTPGNKTGVRGGRLHSSPGHFPPLYASAPTWRHLSATGRSGKRVGTGRKPARRRTGTIRSGAALGVLPVGSRERGPAGGGRA
ncbi:hypothetical protein GCM10014713_63810 [Streptomyces purpureus]|uniref:Uncharacterized protein n=1 Tax=Streptomyces purpureus TaxID=1951 RepID=A0A918HG54_9ACTN|nr:hypothetical protein GCM10014713_63810 [Streptomyces purpureus]